jgi:hypothetical protein
MTTTQCPQAKRLVLRLLLGQMPTSQILRKLLIHQELLWKNLSVFSRCVADKSHTACPECPRPVQGHHSSQTSLPGKPSTTAGPEGTGNLTHRTQGCRAGPDTFPCVFFCPSSHHNPDRWLSSSVKGVCRCLLISCCLSGLRFFSLPISSRFTL